MITLEKIEDIKEEIARFQQAASVLEDAIHEDMENVAARKQAGEQYVFTQQFPALTGAVRRRSMDLTRALAELRKA